MPKIARLIIVVITLFVVIGTGIVIFVSTNAPDSTDVTLNTTDAETLNCLRDADDNCLQLPDITGDNLNGESGTFPADFAGDINIVVLPFDETQQVAVLEYVSLFEELLAADDTLAYYSIAPLPDLAPAVRLLVTGGTGLAVSDAALRELTYIMFLESEETFLSALNLTEDDTAAIQLFIFDADGVALWQGTGNFTDAMADGIQEFLQ
ncbi:MAG: hypothetical protein ACPG7F_02340 [Aggregatilineales bacterium]